EASEINFSCLLRRVKSHIYPTSPCPPSQDAFEINFSCPHGMPERRMGMAMGQDCELLHEVCGWINAASSIPVWAKMTPNITDITQPARVALEAGCEGVSAINTITSVMEVNLKTLRPEPCVEGYTTPGGYSSKAVRPIALAHVMKIARMQAERFPGQGKSLSGIGGVETGENAAEFILLGADTVQVGGARCRWVGHGAGDTEQTTFGAGTGGCQQQ
ncbi:unnamed protein product, partial [Closterium sp. NIES-54]